MRIKVVVKAITRFHDAIGNLSSQKQKWVRAYLPKKYTLVKIISQKQLSPRGEYPKTVEFTVEVKLRKK